MHTVHPGNVTKTKTLQAMLATVLERFPIERMVLMADRELLSLDNIGALISLAEQEHDFISKRTKAALQEAKARGVKLGGYREGHKAHHDAIRQNANKVAQRVASTILSRRAVGATFQAIADELNALGVETARGGKWYGTTVRNYAQRLKAA